MAWRPTTSPFSRSTTGSVSAFSAPFETPSYLTRGASTLSQSIHTKAKKTKSSSCLWCAAMTTDRSASSVSRTVCASPCLALNAASIYLATASCSGTPAQSFGAKSFRSLQERRTNRNFRTFFHSAFPIGCQSAARTTATSQRSRQPKTGRTLAADALLRVTGPCRVGISVR